MVRYDEDLLDNPFYKSIASKPDWLVHAAERDWIVSASFQCKLDHLIFISYLVSDTILY